MNKLMVAQLLQLDFLELRKRIRCLTNEMQPLIEQQMRFELECVTALCVQTKINLTPCHQVQAAVRHHIVQA